MLINEKTLLPISFAFVIGGGAFFLGQTKMDIEANANEISELKITETKDQETINDMSQRLIRIETKVDLLLDKKSLQK